MGIHDIVLPVHLMTFGFIAWTVFRADCLGSGWIRGTEAVLPVEEVRKLHRTTWIGLSIMITTGLIMFWPMREYLLTRPQFYAKMAFVITLVMNGFAIGHLQKVSFTKKYSDLPRREKLPLFISGAVSSLAWVGAATMAFFLIPD